MAILIKLCSDACESTIANNPRVISAASTLLAAVTDHLKVRLEAERSGLLSGWFSVRPNFNRTSEAVDKATIALNKAIHDAWIEAEGRDPRDDDAYQYEFCAMTGMHPAICGATSTALSMGAA